MYNTYSNKFNKKSQIKCNLLKILELNFKIYIIKHPAFSPKLKIRPKTRYLAKAQENTAQCTANTLCVDILTSKSIAVIAS